MCFAHALTRDEGQLLVRRIQRTGLVGRLRLDIDVGRCVRLDRVHGLRLFVAAEQKIILDVFLKVLAHHR